MSSKMDIKDYVPLSKLRRIVDTLKEQPPQQKISFEFLMTACFPTIYDNIMEEMKRQYTLGYLQGRSENEDSGNN